jgi:hypothetical protein
MKNYYDNISNTVVFGQVYTDQKGLDNINMFYNKSFDSDESIASTNSDICLFSFKEEEEISSGKRGRFNFLKKLFCLY